MASFIGIGWIPAKHNLELSFILKKTADWEHIGGILDLEYIC